MTAPTDQTNDLVEMIFELRYALSALALRCKRAGVDVDTVTLSKNDEDFLVRETEDVLSRRAAAGTRATVAAVAQRHVDSLRKAAADREGDEDAR